MARFNSYPELNSPPEPFESVLRVGKVHVRPYKSGSVKHAHVVLRKVDEEVYEDSLGRKRTRGIFSFFAQKVINCKPGKEIFFAVDDYLQERVVAFEANLHNANETDNDVGNSAKSDETLVQRELQSHSLPPKMRKMWARRESVAVKQDVSASTANKRISVGVQAHPFVEHVDLQTAPLLPSDKVLPRMLSVLEEAPLLTSSVETQTKTVSLETPPPLTEPSTQSPDLLSTVAEDLGMKVDLPPESDSRNDSPERSLSPMELESASSSPQHSPRLLVREISSPHNKSDSNPSESVLKATGISQTESMATLVETSPIKVKEEPEDILLPPSPAMGPKSTLRAFCAPVFVPARHNPFHQRNDMPEEVLSSLSVSSNSQPDARSTIVATPTPLTVLKQSAPATPASIWPPTPVSSFASSTEAFHAEDPQSISVKRHVVADSQGGICPAPAFVPATQLSQVSYSEDRSSPISVATLQEAQLRYDESVIPLEGSLIIERTRKRKRTHNDTVPPPLIPDPKLDVTVSQSKEWKPIVKPEPQSPVLSAIPISGPVPNEHKSSQPPPLTLSIPPFMPPTPPSSQRPSDPVKREPADYTPMTFDPPISHPSSTTTTSYRGSRSVVDLTTPISFQNRAPISTPVKRFNQPRRRAAGICSSLPIIRTAQIKMDATGRDTTGVRTIIFDPTGDRFAVICRDNSIRIWDNISYVEIAKLAHSSPVISAVWMEDDISIASMGSNGVVSKWNLVEKNRWMWEKLVVSDDTEPSCFACYCHLIAIASSRRGIRIWECQSGRCIPLGSEIPRRDVLSMKFVNGGSDLLCACSDGNLLQYFIPQCRAQLVTRFKTKVFHVDSDRASSHALVAQALGSAHLVDIAATDKRSFGRILQNYSLRDVEQQYGTRGIHGFKPIFADYGDAVVFGSIEGRVLVWDRRRGQVIHEMDHGHPVLVQAVASFDGGNGEQHLISCTKYGLLTWWRLPIRLF